MKQRITYSGHAIIKMFARGIEEEDVLEIINSGSAIEDYPDDTPYPSKLLSGRSRGMPIHAVVASNDAAGEIIVITVYQPDPARWEPGFTRRKA